MKLRRIVTASAFALLLQGAAHAQQAQGVTTTEQEIVVTAERTEEAVRAFVGEVAVAVRGENQIARWDGRICPGISGLKGRFARPVIDRIAQRAIEVGLDVGEPGCKANILILVTMNADQVTKEVLDNNRDAFGYYSTRGVRTQGRDALNAFVNSDAPVRWWHVSKTITDHGMEVGDDATGDAPTVAVSGASRINRNTRLDFGAVFIVVDATRLDGLSFAGLADYLAMASLAQLAPQTDTSAYPTVLNLFAGPAPDATTPATMTPWDMAYLRGLYSTARVTANAGAQQNDIATSMNRALTKQQ